MRALAAAQTLHGTRQTIGIGNKTYFKYCKNPSYDAQKKLQAILAVEHDVNTALDRRSGWGQD